MTAWSESRGHSGTRKRGSPPALCAWALAALSTFGWSVQRAAAQGVGFAIGGSPAGVGSTGPLVVWQFDQLQAQRVGDLAGLEAFVPNTGIGPFDSFLLDCVVSPDGTTVYTTSADNFLEVFHLTRTGPQYIPTAKIPRVLNVAPNETLGSSVIFQSMELSPDGTLLALCGTSYSGPKFTGAAAGALWLFSPATRKIKELTSATKAFCASASFCSQTTLVAAFLDSDRSGELVVYQQLQGTWVSRKGGAPSPSYSVPAKISCYGNFVAVMRDFNPTAVVTYRVPSLLLMYSRRLPKDPRALGVSLAIDPVGHRIVARTNTSLWVVPYDARTLALSRTPARYSAPCADCNNMPFGVHSIAVTNPKYGEKVYMGGPKGQILVFDLALQPPRFWAPINLGQSGPAQIQTICLQRS